MLARLDLMLDHRAHSKCLAANYIPQVLFQIHKTPVPIVPAISRVVAEQLKVGGAAISPARAVVKIDLRLGERLGPPLSALISYSIFIAWRPLLRTYVNRHLVARRIAWRLPMQT